MSSSLNRRDFLKMAAAYGLLARGGMALAAGSDSSQALIAAAWRGPNASDTYYAGVLVADWASKKLSIRYGVPLPTRPHGLLPEADGSLLVAGIRPGTWLMRIDADGQVSRQIDVTPESATARLNGHAIVGKQGDLVYTTETDFSTGHGRIGVRDRQTLKKLDEWETHGMEPHQVLLDADGNLMVANGGIPRSTTDKMYDLHRMDSSLVRLDAKNGKLLRKWTVGDARLSLRHIAWSTAPDGQERLGVAMQAQHDDAALRHQAPLLAVLEGDELTIPTRANDGYGYGGDLAAAYNGGFVVSSNQAGVAQLWHPGAPDKLTPVVELQEAYAMAEWHGPNPGGGVLVSTAPGLVRWHPTAKPMFLAWPKPMAPDNHWVLISEA